MDMVADDSINVYVDSEKGTVAYNPDGITVRPNPFNPLTFVNVSLGKKSKTELNVYDVRGKIVATLFSGELDAGKHRYSWDAKAVAGGVYFVRLKSERKTLQLKVTLLR